MSVREGRGCKGEDVGEEVGKRVKGSKGVVSRSQHPLGLVRHRRRPLSADVYEPPGGARPFGRLSPLRQVNIYEGEGLLLG